VDLTHETSVTGIIAAQPNNIGVLGIAPDAEIVNVRIFGKNDARSAPLSRFLQSYDWSSGEGKQLFGVRIINSSQSIDCDDTDPLCRENLIHLLGIASRVVNLVFKRGVVMFASAGNGGLDLSQTPGAFHWPATHSPHTVPVGATGPCCAACDGNLSNDDYDLFAGFSNHGFLPDERYIVMPAGNRPVSCPYPKPICQVGALRLPCNAFDNILTLTRQDVVPAPNIRGVTSFGGTSAAAPHASGLAALLLSRYLAQGMDLTAGQLIEAMLGTGDLIDLTVDLGAPGFDPFYGYGRGSAGLIP
jgi:subtilisin family serine protease